VWKLVKVAGAQDKDDGSVLRPIGGFEKASWHLID
jgi:SWI/SNF-related matrix-associated actin-dependent regulator of chromatin subfamily D